MITKERLTKMYVALSFLIMIMIGLVGCGNLEVGAVPPGDSSEEAGEDASLAESDEKQFN